MSEDFAGMNEQKVVYKTLKFGKVGDWFKGTLTGNTKQMVNNLSATKEMQTVFEFKTHGGSFHLIDNRQVNAEPTTPEKGEFWSFITGKQVMLDLLRPAKIGQVVALKFSEEKKSKTPGQNPAKIIKVYLGEMDAEYQGEQAGDLGQQF